MMNTAKIEVLQHQLDKGKMVRWIAMEDGDYFTVKDAAELLGVSPQNIKQIVERYGIVKATPSCEQRKALVDQNLISIRATRTQLLSRESVDALVKIVNTPEAWELWNQVCALLRKPEEYVQMRAEVATSKGESPIDELERIQASLASTLKLNYNLTMEHETRLQKVDTRQTKVESAVVTIGHKVQEHDKRIDTHEQVLKRVASNTPRPDPRAGLIGLKHLERLRRMTYLVGCAYSNTDKKHQMVKEFTNKICQVAGVSSIALIPEHHVDKVFEEAGLFVEAAMTLQKYWYWKPRQGCRTEASGWGKESLDTFLATSRGGVLNKGKF